MLANESNIISGPVLLSFGLEGTKKYIDYEALVRTRNELSRRGGCAAKKR